MTGHNEEVLLELSIAKKDIDCIQKILEGFEGFCICTTKAGEEGIMQLHTTKYFAEELSMLIPELPRKVKIIR